MKKLNYLLIMLLALSFTFVSCKKDPVVDPDDLDEIVEDGFYVVGAATASEKLVTNATMAVGYNENAKDENGNTVNELREGMYEKYIALEGGKEFNLLLKKGTSETKYGATLADVDLAGENEQPNIVVKKGALKENATLKVDESGFYHIVLDLELNQILIAPVQWGMRGDFNGWGFSEMTASAFNKEKMTFTLVGAEIKNTQKFKFAYGSGWKIGLDDEGLVKANTNLGQDLKPGGSDISIGETGVYTITLTWTLKEGSITDSYSVKYDKTGDLEALYPEELYMTGSDFGGWTWGAEGIVSFTPVHSADGAFWAIRNLTAGNGIKLSSINVAGDWSQAFGGLGENIGFTNDGDGNAVVEEDGVYMIYVDFKNNKMAIEPAKVYLTGADLTGAWGDESESFLFTAKDGKLVSPAFDAGGNLRIFAATTIATTDWWTREFNVFDGKIEYRGTGGEQDAVSVSAGQKVTLDFNAGTGTIE